MLNVQAVYDFFLEKSDAVLKDRLWVIVKIMHIGIELTSISERNHADECDANCRLTVDKKLSAVVSHVTILQSMKNVEPFLTSNAELTSLAADAATMSGVLSLTCWVLGLRTSRGMAALKHVGSARLE